ncbi:hypothetical protein GYMLUDRAFT_47027 [Collybiopsis luxurians FD-317 M1]|uniref:Uncharacterized protein n=1 Tax=Collybiopsis luxurians FD-317 M1 TaxID=944289 RepID=A0A0D0C2H6_9AGAR|nr:hypothetical protein GYMLUDRAFT_47027 [Collybiopsis luxurians FD-317 M1]
MITETRRKSIRSSKPDTVLQLTSNMDSSFTVREYGPTSTDSNCSPSPRREHYPVKREPHSPVADLLPGSEIEPTVEMVHGWQHPAELEYITPGDWSASKIILHLISNSFSIPPRTPGKSGNSVFTVTSVDGQTTILPIGYRVPLMFLARFQWLSLKVVLSAASRETEWSEYKFSILHVCRLCSALLSSAQEYVSVPHDGEIFMVMDRKWRCPTFDRALARFRLKWFLSNPTQVEEFWKTFKEEEYEKDVLKFDWRRWALKGYKGFQLTENEVTDGISAENSMRGLKQKDGEWYWKTDDDPVLGGIDAWSLRHSASKGPTPLPSLPTAQPAAILPQSPLIAPFQDNASSEKPPAIVAEHHNHHFANPAMTASSSSLVSSQPNGPIVDTTPQEIVSYHSHSMPPQQPESLPPFSSNAANDLASHLNGNDSHAVAPKTSTSRPTLPRLKTIPQKRPGSPLQYPTTRIPSVRSGSTSLSLAPQESENVNHGSSVEEGVESGSVLPNLEHPPRSRRSLPIPKGRGKHVSSMVSTGSTVQHPSTCTTRRPYVLLSSIQTQPISEITSSIPPAPSAASSDIRPHQSLFTPSPSPAPTSTEDALSSATISRFVEDQIRDIVHSEIRAAIQTSLNSFKKDILGANQREVRDGVRIVVAAMREEFVADTEKHYRDLRTLLTQLRDQNGQTSQRIQSVRKALRVIAMAHTVPTGSSSGSVSTSVPESNRRTKSLPPTLKRIETSPSVFHPLQHLLGEPDPFVEDDCLDDDDWEGGDYDVDYPGPRPNLHLELRGGDRLEDANGFYMDVDSEKDLSAHVQASSLVGAVEANSLHAQPSFAGPTYPTPSSDTTFRSPTDIQTSCTNYHS